MTPGTVRKFFQLSRPLDSSDGIEPTELFSTRNEVDHANRSRLNKLNGESHFFTAVNESFKHDRRYAQRYGYNYDEQVKTFLDHNTRALRKVELKEGAQVMLLKNLSNGLVNGSCGIVVGFRTKDQAQIS